MGTHRPSEVRFGESFFSAYLDSLLFERIQREKGEEQQIRDTEERLKNAAARAEKIAKQKKVCYCAVGPEGQTNAKGM